MGGRLKAKSASGRIVRAMGIFSGVRIVGILCALVRNKLIAAFIGPAGIGLVMLYNSVVDLVGQTTRLSIDQSAQRDVSQSGGRDAAVTVAVVKRWALWLGLGAMVVMCALSPLVSLWTFETFDRWPTFCWLSVVPLCITYANCINAGNQGLRRFRAVALSNVIASVVGLAVSVPLIIWLRIDSILWIVITYGVVTWLGAWMFRPRFGKVKLSVREVVDRGRGFIRLGALITFAMFVTQATSYLFILFLNTFGSVSTLGVYQAGYTLMNSYVGIIFTALFVEYYPRLSAMAHSPRRLSLAASHEVRLTLAILTPLLCLLIVLANPVIRLIYSSDFLGIVPYVVIASVGVVFRVVSWCMAYVILARGDGRAYVVTETVSAFSGLALNIAGYIFWGYIGLGVAYVANYLVYTVVVLMICRFRYRVAYDRRTVLTAVASCVLLAAVALLYLL